MAQFQYTAVNNTGKKLSGIIGAGTEEEARKQLNTFGISLLAIQKMEETPTESATNEPGTTAELTKFEFEAFDKNGRKILGTIPASSRYKAFKRLMDEYEFEVAYVVPVGVSPEERQKAKQEDLSMLKAEYEVQNKTKGAAAKEEERLSAEFEIKKKALLSKVDFILEKIRKVLTDFKSELKPESQKLIQGYIDKLLRIKSSTNLDYIQATSEELLRKVQDQELFLHKERMSQARDMMKLEAQKMMAELHSKPVQGVDLSQNVEEIQARFSGSQNPLLKGLGQWLSRFVSTPAEKTLKGKISVLRGQIWTYRKIVWTAPASTKTDARSSLQALKDEKLRLEVELKNSRHARYAQGKVAAPEEPLVTEEVNSFLSWLLVFYLAAYFLSYYPVAKILPWDHFLPGDFSLLSSSLLRHILMGLFLWNILLTLRLDYLRYYPRANILVIPLGIVLTATLVFNL